MGTCISLHSKIALKSYTCSHWQPLVPLQSSPKKQKFLKESSLQLILGTVHHDKQDGQARGGFSRGERPGGGGQRVYERYGQHQLVSA